MAVAHRLGLDDGRGGDGEARLGVAGAKRPSSLELLEQFRRRRAGGQRAVERQVAQAGDSWNDGVMRARRNSASSSIRERCTVKPAAIG